jgi:hypothetical protein
VLHRINTARVAALAMDDSPLTISALYLRASPGIVRTSSTGPVDGGRQVKH